MKQSNSTIMFKNPLETPEMKSEIAQLHENIEVKIMCDSCHEMEDEDMTHPYGEATFCDSCYEGCIA